MYRSPAYKVNHGEVFWREGWKNRHDFDKTSTLFFSNAPHLNWSTRKSRSSQERMLIRLLDCFFFKSQIRQWVKQKQFFFSEKGNNENLRLYMQKKYIMIKCLTGVFPFSDLNFVYIILKYLEISLTRDRHVLILKAHISRTIRLLASI